MGWCSWNPEPTFSPGAGRPLCRRDAQPLLLVPTGGLDRPKPLSVGLGGFLFVAVLEVRRAPI
jgi:hypothetical protein